MCLVYIVILVYNGRKWLKDCLQTVFLNEYKDFKVVVVDNNSKDDSLSYVENNFPEVKIIRNKRNFGFAEGNNIGIRYALKHSANYIVLLNQDTKVNPDWLTELVRVAEKDSRIGIVGSNIYNYEGEGIEKIFSTVFGKESHFLKDFKEGKLKDSYEVDVTVGASLLVKKEVFEEIGLMDPLYFLYAEEYDFCRRAIYFNYRIVVASKSIIYHYSTLSQNKLLNNNFHFLRNNFLYLIKRPNENFFIIICKYILIDVFTIARDLKMFSSFSLFRKFLIIQIWIIFHLPIIALKRYRESKYPTYLIN